MATNLNHAIDSADSAENLASWLAHLSLVQCLICRGLIAPVELFIEYYLGPANWNMD